ncbi:hypothetical protein AHAS_Ahas20G0076000 [Arachis hypogaea]
MSYCSNSHGGDGGEVRASYILVKHQALSLTHLFSLSGIPAKIEPDRKRKKSPVVPAEQKEKHKQHLSKTKKMSYCSNSHGGNGGEVRASHILVKHQGSRRKASWKDPEGQVIRNTTRDSIISQLKAFRDNIVSVKSKFEDIASRSSNCSSTNRAGELVRNLLAEDKTDNKLEIRSFNDDGLSLPDATLRPVTSTTDVLALVKLGEVHRADTKRLEQLYSDPLLRLVYDCILMDAEMGIDCRF